MWVPALLGTALFLLGALLLVPVELGFRLIREERSRGELSVGWLFGRLRKEVRVRPRRRQRRGKPSRSARAARRLALLARTRGFPRRCGRLLRQLLRHTQIRELRLQGRIGLDDPADTGLLFAALAPALSGLGAFPAVAVNVEPDFERPGLAGQASGAVRLVPARVLWALVRFLLSPEALRAARTLATGRPR